MRLWRPVRHSLLRSRSTLEAQVERVVLNTLARVAALPLTNAYGLCGVCVRAGEVLGEAAGRGGSGVALMDCSVSKRFLRFIAS